MCDMPHTVPSTARRATTRAVSGERRPAHDRPPAVNGRPHGVAQVGSIKYSNHLLCDSRWRERHHMVDIAQQVEHLIVVQKVARSNRVIHPIPPRKDGLLNARSTPKRHAGYGFPVWCMRAQAHAPYSSITHHCSSPHGSCPESARPLC